MAMTACKECGGSISSKAEVCPHCGFRLRDGKGLKVFRALFGLVLGTVLVLTSLAILGWRS